MGFISTVVTDRRDAGKRDVRPEKEIGAAPNARRTWFPSPPAGLARNRPPSPLKQQDTPAYTLYFTGSSLDLSRRNVINFLCPDTWDSQGFTFEGPLAQKRSYPFIPPPYPYWRSHRRKYRGERFEDGPETVAVPKVIRPFRDQRFLSESRS